MSATVSNHFSFHNRFAGFLWLILLLASVSTSAFASDESALVDTYATDYQFLAVPHDSSAGVLTSYDLYFALPVDRLSQLKGGGISLDFPESYDLSQAVVSAINHDGTRHKLNVTGVETGERTITILLTIENNTGGTSPISSTTTDTVNFSLVLDSVSNATVAGTQQLNLLLFDNTDRVLLSNVHSNPFPIKAGSFVSLTLLPNGPQSLRSGDVISYSLTGVDEFGNIVTNNDVSWTLTADSDPIGYFVGSAFVTTGVGTGQIQAETGGAIILSEPIEVIAGPLAQIILTISPDQVVNVPFVGPGQIVLLDASNNPVIDYDLAANPITLVSSLGNLTPFEISDPLLADSGVVDLSPVGIKYFGITGPVRIKAVSGLISSSEIIVSFNGYDVVSLTTLSGQPLTQVYSNLLTNVVVDVRNGGALLAEVRPTLNAHFLSGGGSLVRTFAQKANGEISSLTLELPTDNLTQGANQLHVELHSQYSLNGSTYPAADSLIVPISVKLPLTMTLVPGSFQPESVYAGIPFAVDFAVQAPSSLTFVDSSFIQVRLYSDTLLPAVDTIISGWLPSVQVVADTIKYTNLEGIVRSDLPPGDYIARLDHFLISGADLYATTTRYPGTLTVLAPAAISYTSGSLTPRVAQAGTESQFSFDLLLSGGESLALDPAATNFTINGNGFSTTANLTAAGNMLVPGANHLTADSLFIPASQLNQNLTAAMNLAYQIAGAANFKTFSSDFGGETIQVEALPLVQISSVTAIAPNSPKVNTNQPFKIRCRVRNLSSDPVGAFRLYLSSDGSSQYDPHLTIPSLAGQDSAIVDFDIVAAIDTNSAEVFLLTVDSGDVVSGTPLDNSASVTVQFPASLQLTRLPAADSIFAERGSIVSLTLSLQNVGQAATSAGVLRVTNGSLFGLGDDYLDTITAGQPLTLPLAAPDFDTTVTILFDWWEKPIDLNDSSVAPVNPESFALKVITIAFDAQLIVSADVQSSSLLLPGNTIDVATLSLANIGTFPDADVRVDSLAISFLSTSGQIISPGRLLDPSSTGLFEGNNRIAEADFRYDRAVFVPNDFVVPIGQSLRQLTLRLNLLAAVDEPFRLKFTTGSIFATFAGGPQAGQKAGVSSPDGHEDIVSHVFSPVTQRSLAGSFAIRDNPFNPDAAPAEMQFYMPNGTGAELRILTLTGERVYSRNFASGELTIGDMNVIEWDGRNQEGQMVLDGVYVAILTISNSDERAVLKIAVVK